MIVYKSEFEGVKSNGLDLKFMTLIKGHDLLAGYRPYVYCLFLVKDVDRIRHWDGQGDNLAERDTQFLFARGDEEL